MKRRAFVISAAGLQTAVRAHAEDKAAAADTYYRIVQVDPRLVTMTKDTIAVGYEKKKSDVIGSVYLSMTESAKFKTVLTTALTASTDVPACGHAPAYVIVRYEAGQPMRYVSVCALCMTWCGPEGDLRVLDASQLMPLLTKILPLPAAFSKVKKLPDLWALDPSKSHLELPSPQ